MFYCLIVCIHRDVVIINSRLHSNAGYGEESVAVNLENRYSITKSSKGSFWLIILDIFIIYIYCRTERSIPTVQG